MLSIHNLATTMLSKPTLCHRLNDENFELQINVLIWAAGYTTAHAYKVSAPPLLLQHIIHLREYDWALGVLECYYIPIRENG